MRLYPAVILVALISTVGLDPLQAQVQGGPVSDLAKKLQTDPKERQAAGKRLEAFLLNPGADGKVFVRAGVDQAPLGAVAREWANKEDAGRLAVLIFVASPDSKSEARLRAALSPWTGEAQITNDAGDVALAYSFLTDAADKAAKIFSDAKTRAEIESSIEANDRDVPTAPNAQKASERARTIMRPGRGLDLFGPDREAPGSAPGVAPGAGRTQAAPAGTGGGKQPETVKANLDSGVVPSPLDATVIGKSPAQIGSGVSSSLLDLGDSLLNPLMYVIPGLGRLYSGLVARDNKDTSVQSKGDLAALSLRYAAMNPSFTPDAITGGMPLMGQGAGAVISGGFVSTANKKASAQAYLEGVIFFQKGAYEDARSAWKRSSELDPSNKDAAAGLEQIKKLSAPVK